MFPNKNRSLGGLKALIKKNDNTDNVRTVWGRPLANTSNNSTCVVNFLISAFSPPRLSSVRKHFKQVLTLTQSINGGAVLLGESGMWLGGWGQPSRPGLVEVQEMVDTHSHAMLSTVRIFFSFWATVYKTVRSMLSDCCPVCLSVLSCLSVTLVYCGQMAG